MTQRNGNGWKTWALSILGAALFLVLGLYGRSIQGQVDSSKTDHAEDLARVESRVLHLVDTNSRDISETKGDIREINANIENIEDDVRDLKSDVGTIKDDMNAMKLMQRDILNILTNKMNGDTVGGLRP